MEHHGLEGFRKKMAKYDARNVFRTKFLAHELSGDVKTTESRPKKHAVNLKFDADCRWYIYNLQHFSFDISL
jgi:hypothetical protein